MNGDDERSRTETATLGAGCFWCVEAVFDELAGVRDVSPGYAGGHVPNPTYEQVCSGRTGHIEVADITYDPSVISFRDLLDVFFTIHDPTSMDRQGGDVGEQYRSVIFFRDDGQRAEAERAIAEADASGRYDRPVVTEVRPLEAFYPAEDYHRDYFARNPNASYCRAVIAPKVAEARRRHVARLRR